MFLPTVQQKIDAGLLPEKIGRTIQSFYTTFKSALEAENIPLDEGPLIDFLNCVVEDFQDPYEFELYHEKVRAPFDYYKMGLDFFRPLILFERSKVLDEENLAKVEQQIKAKDNVVFLSNHQAEPDPQVISLLLEERHPELAEEMIFVAGHRVVTDPLTKPFSRGRNLLCIYSKRYIEDEPTLKQERQYHNQATMNKMSQLLAEGGKCIYVAPSGGRDRPGPTGELEVAPFDPQSIEMFWLMAQKSGHPTHFYPLSIASYNLLPPPNSISKDIGEVRTTQRTPVHLAIGKEIDMLHFSGSEEPNKKVRRQSRATYIWKLVKQGYETIIKESP